MLLTHDKHMKQQDPVQCFERKLCLNVTYTMKRKNEQGEVICMNSCHGDIDITTA